MEDIEQKIDRIISYIFGECDMRQGEINRNLMLKIKKYCLQDIQEHPNLKTALKTKKEFFVFVIQSMIYMLRE